MLAIFRDPNRVRMYPSSDRFDEQGRALPCVEITLVGLDLDVALAVYVPVESITSLSNQSRTDRINHVPIEFVNLEPGDPRRSDEDPNPDGGNPECRRSS